MLSGPEFCVECDGDIRFTQKIRLCECALSVVPVVPVVPVVVPDDQIDRARLTCVSLTRSCGKFLVVPPDRTSELLIQSRRPTYARRAAELATLVLPRGLRFVGPPTLACANKGREAAGPFFLGIFSLTQL